MEVGEAHGGLDDVGVEIGDACRAEEWKVVPYGTIRHLLSPTTTCFNLAHERVAEFIGPVGSPVGDDMGIATDVCLRVVVDDLGSAGFA